MLPSYEIIDPSIHIMIDKTSDMNCLLKENKKLKITTYAVIGLSLLTVLGLIIYFSPKSKKKKKKKEEEKNIY